MSATEPKLFAYALVLAFTKTHWVLVLSHC